MRGASWPRPVHVEKSEHYNLKKSGILKGYLINPVARGLALLSAKGVKSFILRAVADLPENAHVLSVGAGGPLASELELAAQRKNLRVTTFDIDPGKNPDINGDIAHYKLPESTYDAVFMIEVLEHVRDSRLVPDQLYHTLKDGGRLFLSTPFIFPLHERPHDYYRYTRYGLVAMFENFHELEIQPRNNWVEALLVLPARMFKEKTLRGRIVGTVFVTLALVLQPVAWLLGRILPNDYITSGYLLSAKKPSKSELK